MVLNIIRQAISEYNLISKGDKILVGLSGGADSVCLTHALCTLKDEIGFDVAAAHLNHGIRGEEALRDESFAKELAASLGIVCYTKTLNIPFIAKENSISEETAGRNERYAFFDELCQKHGFMKIATAHNKNDNAETILMNFMRGSSLGGLCGIPVSRGSIIRPLINVTRADIESYCSENALAYMTDSTNLTEDYTRNKIRNTLIPLIQTEFNANFINTITANSVLIKEDSKYLDGKALEAYNDAVNGTAADVQKLLRLNVSIRKRVIRLMLKNAYGSLDGVSSVYIDDIITLLNKQSGTAINLADDIIARIEYNRLIIEKSQIKNTVGYECEFNCPDSGIMQDIGKRVTISVVNARKNDGALYLSVDTASKIVIRSRKSGDKFSPSGMNGTKKVKQYFTDRKIPQNKRDLIPVIEIDGKIAAVGSRVDNDFLFNDKGIRIEFTDV